MLVNYQGCSGAKSRLQIKAKKKMQLYHSRNKLEKKLTRIMIPFARLLHGEAFFTQRWGYFLFHHLCPHYDVQDALDFVPGPWIPYHSYWAHTDSLLGSPIARFLTPLKMVHNTASESMTTTSSYEIIPQHHPCKITQF